MNELRHRKAFVAGLGAHRQLVAKVAGRGVAHAGNAQVLAQRRRCLHVKVVQRNDAVDDLGLRQVADSQQHILQLPGLVFVGYIKDVVERFSRPVRVGEALGRDQQSAASLPLALQHELSSLEITREAQDGQGSCR